MLLQAHVVKVCCEYVFNYVCVYLSVQKKKKGGRVLIDGGGSNVTMYNKKNSSMISVGPRFSKFHLYVHISRLM